VKGGNGFGMVPKWVRGHLTANEIAVYVALTWRMGAGGSVFPSHETIAEDAGMSRRTAMATLKSLRDKGLVDWSNRSKKGGGKTSNVYTVSVTKPLGWTESDGQNLPNPCAESAHEVDTPKDASTKDPDSVPIAMPTSSGPRDRGTNVFDADALAAELEDDFEANGFLANHWADGAEQLIASALAEVRANDAIKDADAWLAAAVEHGTPVRKAARLLQIVGDEDE
jgi:DNA-binding transcriptional MocR family regulator